MLSAERFSAADAHRLGLIHEVVDAQDLDEMVMTFVHYFKQGGSCAHRETKSLIELIDQSDFDQALIEETAARIARVRASDEGKEGIRSFLEKRKPKWMVEDKS
jgi:methylglutaconyl-CoA hydratase